MNHLSVENPHSCFGITHGEPTEWPRLHELGSHTFGRPFLIFIRNRKIDIVKHNPTLHTVLTLPQPIADLSGTSIGEGSHRVTIFSLLDRNRSPIEARSYPVGLENLVDR